MANPAPAIIAPSAKIIDNIEIILIGVNFFIEESSKDN